MNRYDELKQEFGYVEGLVGNDEDNLPVMVTIDEESAEIKTFQENGWVRINVYYRDGTEEELYRKWFTTQLFIWKMVRFT